MRELDYNFGADRNRILDNLDRVNGWRDNHLRPIEMNGTDNKIIAVFKRDDDNLYIIKHNLYTYKKIDEINIYDKNNVEKILEEYK